MGTMQGPEASRQNLSAKEFELIRQLIQSRAGQGREMAYEELEGYEVPPRTQFSMLNKPAVTIKEGHFNFNMACIRLFANVQYVLPVVNASKHRLAVIPCAEEESSSIDWARMRADQKWVNKSITNRDLVSKIGAFMKWRMDCRYKVLGEVRLSPRGPILVFELDEAIMFTKQEVAYTDAETGEARTKKKDIKYYPEKYRGKIGMAYSDYAEARQMSMFEDISNYFSQDDEASSSISAACNLPEHLRTNAQEASNTSPSNKDSMDLPGEGERDTQGESDSVGYTQNDSDGGDGGE